MAILCLAQIGAARADNISDGLKRDYLNHVLGVRYAIHKGDQEFDQTGNPVNPAPDPTWEVYGGVLIKNLSLKKDQLRIEGMRVALPDRMEKGKPVAIPLGKVRFEIHLDHPITSMDEARNVLGRVFYLDENDVDHRKPELRRSGSEAPNPILFKAAKVHPGFVAPKPQYTPEPDFSEPARRAKFQGTVQLDVLIDPRGEIAAVRVDRGLGYGLDENAMETVKNWRFLPATNNGRPVSVWMPVEVEFHLFGR